MNNKYRDKIVEYLDHENEPVVRAMSGALCNLALNPEYATELGESSRAVLVCVTPRSVASGLQLVISSD